MFEINRQLLLGLAVVALLVSCSKDNSVEQALQDYQHQQENEARKQFEAFVRQNALRVLATATDGDVTAELWHVSVAGNVLSATWLLKSTSSRTITGGGSGTSLTNMLLCSGKSVSADMTGGGNTWSIGSTQTPLPPPYGATVRRSFRFPTQITGRVSFILTERVRFDGAEEGAEIFHFSFKNVVLPEIKED